MLRSVRFAPTSPRWPGSSESAESSADSGGCAGFRPRVVAGTAADAAGSSEAAGTAHHSDADDRGSVRRSGCWSVLRRDVRVVSGGASVAWIVPGRIRRTCGTGRARGADSWDGGRVVPRARGGVAGGAAGLGLRNRPMPLKFSVAQRMNERVLERENNGLLHGSCSR